MKDKKKKEPKFEVAFGGHTTEERKNNKTTSDNPYIVTPGGGYKG